MAGTESHLSLLFLSLCPPMHWCSWYIFPPSVMTSLQILLRGILNPSWNDSYLENSQNYQCQAPPVHSGLIDLRSGWAWVFFISSQITLMCYEGPHPGCLGIGHWLNLSHLSYSPHLCTSWRTVDFSGINAVWEGKACSFSKEQSGGLCLREKK